MSRKRNRDTVVCGMHIGAHEVRMAKIERAADGASRLVLDQATAPDRQSRGFEWLSAAVEQLVARHHLRRVPLTVTLDGDYCVTRVTTGSPDEVDRGLRMLSSRVPRYLGLGPGEKITGGYRISLNKQRDYAVTGVANRRLVEALQQILAKNDLRPQAVEPTLVAVARLMSGMPSMEAPVLVVDGSGTQWDVAIVHEGRLLLDYRPSGAREADRFRSILAGHMARLNRFCERHRQMARSELRDLYIYGPEDKVDGVQESFQGHSVLAVRRLIPAEMLREMEVPAEASESCWVGAVAAAMTMLRESSGLQVADLLSTVRTRQTASPVTQWAWALAPAALVASITAGLFATVQSYRERAPEIASERARLEEQIGVLRDEIATLDARKRYLGGLRRIEQVVHHSSGTEALLEQIPQMLPDAARLNRVLIAEGGVVRISGTALNETTIYDVVSGLRRIPGVRDVVLQETSPINPLESDETQFAILVKIDSTIAAQRA